MSAASEPAKEKQRTDADRSPVVAVIHVINKFKVHRKNQAFQCLMIYQDLESEYCFIKPLLAKNDIEISMELLRIFTTCGPPDELLINSCSQELVDNIEENMKTLCPMFKIKYIKKFSDKQNENKAMNIVEELHKWTENTNKDEWEIGCSIVQYTLNTKKDKNIKLSPQERLFRNMKNRSEKNLSQNLTLTENLNNQLQDKSVVEKANKVIESPESKKISSVAVKIERDTVIDNQAQQNDRHTDALKLEINHVKVKTENNLNEKVVLYEGGLIFPALRQITNAQVEIKVERLDDF